MSVDGPAGDAHREWHTSTGGTAGQPPHSFPSAGLGVVACRPRAVSSAGERPPHTREVTGSIPVLPTCSTPVGLPFGTSVGTTSRAARLMSADDVNLDETDVEATRRPGSDDRVVSSVHRSDYASPDRTEVTEGRAAKRAMGRFHYFRRLDCPPGGQWRRRIAPPHRGSLVRWAANDAVAHRTSDRGPYKRCSTNQLVAASDAPSKPATYASKCPPGRTTIFFG